MRIAQTLQARLSASAAKKLQAQSPLAAQLAAADEAVFIPNKSIFRHRSNVISQELCDDTLRLLEPSLKDYHGCTIFDCNPGPGLFSQKLHELVKPRAHLLLEPQPERYKSFLDPLVNRPDSTYRHVNLIHYTPKALANMQAPLADLCNGAMVSPIAIDPKAPILVLSNQAFGIKQEKRKQAASASESRADDFTYYFQQYLSHPVNSRGIHKHAPARLLLWTYNEHKQHILPRNLATNKSLNAQLQEYYHVREIVGGKWYNGVRRPAQIDILSALRTAARMQRAGISLPANRRSDLHSLAMAFHQHRTATAADELDHFMHAYSAQTETPTDIVGELALLARLERDLANGKIPRWKPAPPGMDKRKTYLSDEYTTLSALRTKLETLACGTPPNYDGNDDTVRAVVLALSDLNESERRLALAQQISDTDTSEALKTMAACNDRVQQAWRTLRIGTFREKERKATIDIDNIEAFKLSSSPNQDLHLLDHDNRPFEPLETTPSEFWPHNHQLSLIDYLPRPGSSALLGRPSIRKTPFIRLLETIPPGLTNLVQMLEGIENNPAPWMLEQCPSLRDPLRGGRMHVENLRLRCLNRGMVEEVVRAWEGWSFRKEDAVLLGRVEGDREW